MVFTTQQALDITTANAKVSADGTINTHSDVDALTPQTGDVLAWNGTVWTSMTIGHSITEQQALDIIAANAKISADGPINTHSDVQTANNITGQVLMWDGTNWVNTTKTFITEQQALHIATNNAKVSADLSINTHSDVTIYLPAKNDILQWSGTQWVNSPFKAFGTSALTITNTPACASMQLAPLTPLLGSHGPGSDTTDANRILANAWNGTPFNPCGLTNDQLYDTIVKGNYILGLEAEYNKLPPYQNHLLPTEEEQLNWMVRVINHIRKLYGNPNPVKVSQRLTNEALWRIEKAWCSNFMPTSVTDWYFIPALGLQTDYPSTINEWPTPTVRKGVNNYQWRYELAAWAITQDIPYWTHMRSLCWSILKHQQNKSLFQGFYGMDEIGIAVCTVPTGFTYAGAIAYSLVSQELNVHTAKMPELLFDPTCWSNKRSSKKIYEENICTQIVKSSRRRANNQISHQQTQDILNNNLKISADGTIATHNDIAIMTPQLGDVFTFAGDAWVNMPWTDYTPITTQQASDITTNLAKISADGPINTHSDVQTVNNIIGQIVHWDGLNWVNTTKAYITTQQAIDITTANTKVSADGTINTHSDVQTVNNVTGQVLMFDGSIWKESTLPPVIN